MTEARVASQWQEIASAPLDGTRFLGFDKAHLMMVCNWDKHDGCFVVSWSGDVIDDLTHWRPMPLTPFGDAYE